MPELTTERRNEIAWLFFLHQLRNREKVFSVAETCTYYSEEYMIPYGIFLTLAVENAYDEILFPVEKKPVRPELVLKRNELVWFLHIFIEFKRGFKIGESFNRDIGNWATKINVENIEVREYYLELIAIITSLLCENRWWQTFENASLRLESLKAIVAETRKVNSAEAGS